MKIRITKDCECVHSNMHPRDDPKDMLLRAGSILEGRIEQVTNWDNDPLDAIDVVSDNKFHDEWCGIPNDCWEMFV